jgi:hypothetical protein
MPGGPGSSALHLLRTSCKAVVSTVVVIGGKLIGHTPKRPPARVAQSTVRYVREPAESYRSTRPVNVAAPVVHARATTFAVMQDGAVGDIVCMVVLYVESGYESEAGGIGLIHPHVLSKLAGITTYASAGTQARVR